MTASSYKGKIETLEAYESKKASGANKPTTVSENASCADNHTMVSENASGANNGTDNHGTDNPGIRECKRYQRSYPGHSCL